MATRSLDASWRAAPAIGGIVAVLVIAFAMWPGTALSLIWPQEYAILLAWSVLGFVLYRVTPRGPDEVSLRTLLGDHYAKLADRR